MTHPEHLWMKRDMTGSPLTDRAVNRLKVDGVVRVRR
jgi:hypothetical protein